MRKTCFRRISGLRFWIAVLGFSLVYLSVSGLLCVLSLFSFFLECTWWSLGLHYLSPPFSVDSVISYCFPSLCRCDNCRSCPSCLWDLFDSEVCSGFRKQIGNVVSSSQIGLYTIVAYMSIKVLIACMKKRERGSFPTFTWHCKHFLEHPSLNGGCVLKEERKPNRWE